MAKSEDFTAERTSRLCLPAGLFRWWRVAGDGWRVTGDGWWVAGDG